ncbi:hypothetical protein [Pseudolysinimonas sp.]|uniref:hypothetical protein n=1 Tax=Pseudolysinimonas sp. TaxID=2680009 RepID=UPI003F807D6B
MLGPIGCVGLAVGWIAATVGSLRTRGPWALLGLLGAAAAALVQRSHVYFPVGTAGLAALIVAGVALVALPARQPLR